jgi:hypothetical protein
MIRSLSNGRKTMNDEWLKSKAASGVCGHDAAEVHDAAMTDIRNDYRWTPACQRAFLEELAYTGSVLRSSKHVAKSPRSAYDLRFRRDGAAFRLGWDAAILVSRDCLNDMLMDRAVNGYEETTFKNDDGTVMRGKFDNRLSQGLLARLDKLAEAQALKGSRHAQVQLIVQDWESFLELIERGGKGSEAALFFEARDPGPVESRRPFDCELDRISAGDAAPADMMDEEPEVAVQRLGVWYDEKAAEWRTNYPKSEEQDGAYITETGIFGDLDYERTLSDAEESGHLAALARTRQPWIDAAAKARDAWFGEKIAA